MEVAAGSGAGETRLGIEGAGFKAGVGADTGVSAASNGTAAFASGKATGASWQSMLRAWGMVARTSSGVADQAANKTAETGAADGSNESPDVESAQAAFARAGTNVAEPALTRGRGNGPVVNASAPANNAARTIGLESAANARSAAAIRAAGISSSSTGTSPSANVKGEKKASEKRDAGAQQTVVQKTNGLPAPLADATGPSVSVAQLQPQIVPSTLSDSQLSDHAKQIDESSSGASEAEPEVAIASIRSKASPSITAASTPAPASTKSIATARATIPASAIPASASAAQSLLRDEETTGRAATPIGLASPINDQEELAANSQASLAASAIATSGASLAGSAGRQRAQSASSGVEDHKTLTGDFAAHRDASTAIGASVDSAVAATSADKLSSDNSNANSSTSPSPQMMVRSAHEAATGGVSAAAGQGIGTHVAEQGSAPESSTWVRDPGGAQGTAAARGEPAASEVAAPQETFAALDAGTNVGMPSWIHAGGRQAEAGFDDPALGWVGVRADLSGGIVHAALLPGSTEAAQALSGHLAGLNAYLAEQHAPVATLTMASPGTSVADASVDQNMQQNAGHHGEQSPAPAPQTGAQPFAATSTLAAAVSAATNVGLDAIAYAGGSRGTHISVMA